MLRFVLTIFALGIFVFPTPAQCPVFDLQTLQSVIRTPVPERETKIQDLGFDFDTDIKDGMDEVRQYHKCWQTAFGGNIIYKQVLQWNFGLNSIVFLTLDEHEYTALHESIVGRADKTGGRDAGNTYIGRLYRYYFGIQQVNGVDYYMVSIRDK